MNNCKVFTPQDVANQMLDLAHYQRDLYGKKVLESACGEGDLLLYIVDRYIVDCLNKNYDNTVIKKGLENDIWGYDIDKTCCKKCNLRLDKISAKYGIEDVKWNIKADDSLRFCPIQRFNFIFGNPPYITYRDLDESDRNNLRLMYLSCNEGAFDYCYAFLEHDLSCLSSDGKLVYLIPSSIFKNVHANNLRKFIHPYVTQIVDFTTKKLFGAILTSSAILICENGNDNKHLKYLNAATDEDDEIDKEKLTMDKWIFTSKNRAGQDGKNKFSDYFSASIVIATLLNEAFVLRNVTEESQGFLIDGLYIEKEAIRPTASPRTLRYNKEEYIIFPYFYKNGLNRYSEDEFRSYFPSATAHLKKYYEKLLLRDTDKNTKWFEYGRSQALSTICQNKLLLSTVVTNKVEIYQLTADTIPYSGIYIYPKSMLSLDVAKRILQSEEFLQYVHNIGIHANGKSLRITCKDIESFKFNWPEECM